MAYTLDVSDRVSDFRVSHFAITDYTRKLWATVNLPYSADIWPGAGAIVSVTFVFGVRQAD